MTNIIVAIVSPLLTSIVIVMYAVLWLPVLITTWLEPLQQRLNKRLMTLLRLPG